MQFGQLKMDALLRQVSPHLLGQALMFRRREDYDIRSRELQI